MEITAKMVADLRQMTGVGMMECKKALTEANGNVDEAIKILNKNSAKKVEKKAGRIAAEGAMGIYDHMNLHQKVAMVERLKNESVVFQKMLNSPYFAKINIIPCDTKKEEKYYIGMHTLNDAQNNFFLLQILHLYL